MADLATLSQQAIAISQKINQFRDFLTKETTVQAFRRSPQLGDSLVRAANTLKSKALVLYGLKEFLEQQTDFLPTKEELLGDRAHNWLSEGDVVGGWISYFADRPRVIVSVELTGYRWHFLGEDQNVQGPGIGQMKTDRWFQSYGWVKLSGADVGEIAAEQQSEIAELDAQIAYFSSKAFLQSA